MTTVAKLIEELSKFDGDLPVQLVIANPKATICHSIECDVDIKSTTSTNISNCSPDPSMDGEEDDGIPCVELFGWLRDCDLEEVIY